MDRRSDGIIKRVFIGVLTVYSKTFYTVDKGVQRGAEKMKGQSK